MMMSTMTHWSKDKQNNKNHYTPRNATLPSIGSTVAVQQEDTDRWIHGTIVGKDDYNHNCKSNIMCIAKTGRMITRSGKHVKATLIMAEQYQWDQLSKHIKTDPLEDFLKQYENKHLQ